MDMEKVEKNLRNIYINLGKTDLDKASAVAKGCFAALSIYTLGRAMHLPSRFYINQVVPISTALSMSGGVGAAAFAMASRRYPPLPKEQQIGIAAAAGLFSFLVFNSMASSLTIPVTLTFLTAIVVGFPLLLGSVDPERNSPTVDQEFRIDLTKVPRIAKKIHLRDWLTGLTIGSFALMVDRLIRGTGVTSWSIKANETFNAITHGFLSYLFINAGMEHIASSTPTPSD